MVTPILELLDLLNDYVITVTFPYEFLFFQVRSITEKNHLNNIYCETCKMQSCGHNIQ